MDYGSDSNESIAVQVVLEHEPKSYTYWDGDTISCSAEGCSWVGIYGWAKHVSEAINDHLGLWGPEDENEEVDFGPCKGGVCEAYAHDEMPVECQKHAGLDEEPEDPFANGPYGDEW